MGMIMSIPFPGNYLVLAFIIVVICVGIYYIYDMFANMGKGVKDLLNSKPKICPVNSLDTEPDETKKQRTSEHLFNCWRCPMDKVFSHGKCIEKIPAGSIGTDRPLIHNWDRKQVYSTVGLGGLERACPLGSQEIAGSCWIIPAGYSYSSPGIAKKPCTGSGKRWDSTACWFKEPKRLIASPHYGYLKSIKMVPRSGCRGTKVQVGGLCYPKCPDGYTRDPGNVEYCTSDCPKGTTRKGPYICAKNTSNPTDLGPKGKVGVCPIKYKPGKAGLLCIPDGK